MGSVQRPAYWEDKWHTDITRAYVRYRNGKNIKLSFNLTLDWLQRMLRLGEEVSKSDVAKEKIYRYFKLLVKVDG